MCIFKRRRRFERSDCPICLEHIIDDNKNLLSCGHWVHRHCILKDFYYTNILKCPMCRKLLNFNWDYRINYEDTVSLVISLIVFTTIRLPEVFYSLSDLIKIINR